MMDTNMLELRRVPDRAAWENNCRWEVDLSNGETIFRNDEEIGSSSWIILNHYLIQNPSLHIKKMRFGFRDNMHSLPELADGYYFRNSVVGSLAGSKSSFIVGILKNGKCLVEKWELPEMNLMWKEERDPSEAGESLIQNIVL
jgi:hypothetical protein